MQTLIVTGAAGFIGATLCRTLRQQDKAQIIGVDAMTYAASRESLGHVMNDPGFRMVQADVTDAATMAQLFIETMPDGIIHLAGQSHADRSLDSPSDFLTANVVGTFSLLETIRSCFPLLPSDKQDRFRFLYLSTDELYGTLGESAPPWTENAPCSPSTPLAATMACAEHLIEAWHKSYRLPILIATASTTYGPLQFPEKLIPLTITRALRGESLPLYGQGEAVRDWLYIDDLVNALMVIYDQGEIGEKYHISAGEPRRNIDVMLDICATLDQLLPESVYRPYKRLITPVADRPAHDKRRALDSAKLQASLGWAPQTRFTEGLQETVRWYIRNQLWCQSIRSRGYVGQRLGLGKKQ